MSRKGLGITSVLDRSEKVVGIISDGDLRRHLETDSDLLKRTALECMTSNPKTISENELATKALNLMEKMKITSLLVLDEEQKLKGIIHIHDLWQTELF
jgi:arabinose-5-phosphate isomerase